MCKECRQNPCHPQCPNYADSPLLYCSVCDKAIFAEDIYFEICDEIYCEDCISDCKRTAEADNYYDDCDGLPIFSYGDRWEE